MAKRPSARAIALWVALMSTAIGCIGIGAWQWARLGSASGVDQNAGYVLLWPVFGAFLLVAGLTWRRLQQSATSKAHPAAAHVETLATRELPPGLLPTRISTYPEPDPATVRYNAYLALLNDRELQQHLRAAGLDNARRSHGD
ncbi:transcriptional regulator [Nocardia carnea]|uniref:Transcriptional regulator n=1 Tax=Nocardia carnea TaxID=37328 RepID=A0ABW7TUQ0_9NOCA|nr:transcriptional regulator [Nocardia carnea]